MNKNVTILGLSVLLASGVIAGAVLTGSAKSFNGQLTNASDQTYTLQLDATDHLVASDSYIDANSQKVSGFSIRNDAGTKFFFHRNDNPAPSLNTEGAIVLNNTNVDSFVMLRSDLDAVEYAHPINGIKSITVNFDIKDALGDTDISDIILLKVNYGFVHDGASYFANEYTLESGVTYNFENTLPSVFNLMIDMNGYTDGSHNNYYKAYLRSLTIVYSCATSDTSKEAFLDKYFSGDPIVVKRDEETNKPTSIQCGAYPQSLLTDNIKKMYLDAKCATATPLNGYYLLKDNGYNESDVRSPSVSKLVPSAVKLYARKKATNTGFDGEYTNGEYYWFNVEPVEWTVLLDQENDNYLVATSKVINTGFIYKNSSDLNVAYNNSDLKTSINTLSSNMLRTNDSIQLNNDFNVKIYALSSSQYRAKSATSQATDYARTGVIINKSASTGLCVGYWTNRVGYSNPSQHRAEAINSAGAVDTPYQTDSRGVRPGMIISVQ